MTSTPRLAMKRNDTRTYSLWAWTKSYIAWLFLLPLYLGLWAFAATFKRLPDWMTRKLLREHDAYTSSHPMDFRIPPDDNIPAYMHRWWRIARNAYFNVYYHLVLRGDDDRALHDHPWWSFSIVLDGGYFEHTIDAGGVNRKVWYEPGSVRFRRSGTFAHRLELATEPFDYSQVADNPLVGYAPPEMPVKTIFVTGPVLRRWGFHHPDQWVDAYDWDSFMAAKGLANAMPMGGGSDGAISDRNLR